MGQPTRFSIQTSGDDAGSIRLLVQGELDLATVSAFNAAISEHQRRERGVLLDLTLLEFIDSSGICAMFEAISDAKTNGWSLGIKSTMTPPVRRAFEVANLLPMLPLVEE